MISIVLVTFNRLHLLRKCAENVLARTSPRTTQIIIWNNASRDGTAEFLATLRDPRIHVVNHTENVGTNAYAMAFERATGQYLLELDDDIIDAPRDWDSGMLDAFLRIPRVGFMAADVIDDGKSMASDIRYRTDRHLYTERELNGVNIVDGPTGGWCTMTSRAIYDEVGGFKINKDFNFWHEDGAFAKSVQKAGYLSCLLSDVKVFHASGKAYSQDPEIDAAKGRYYTWYQRHINRRKAIRKWIDSVPGVRSIYSWLRPRHW